MNLLVCLAVSCSMLIVNIQGVHRKIGDLRLKVANGVPEQYCIETDTNVEWAIDQKKTQDCFDCECSVIHEGILCYGKGYEDGVPPPAGCTKRRLEDFEMGEGETCCYQMVNEDNQAVVCGARVCA